VMFSMERNKGEMVVVILMKMITSIGTRAVLSWRGKIVVVMMVVVVMMMIKSIA